MIAALKALSHRPVTVVTRLAMLQGVRTPAEVNRVLVTTVHSRRSSSDLGHELAAFRLPSITHRAFAADASVLVFCQWINFDVGNWPLPCGETYKFESNYTQLMIKIRYTTAQFQ